MRWSLTVGLIVCLGATLGCSSTEQVTKAEAAVEKFHRQLAAERYSHIYLEAHENFRENTGEDKIIRFFRGVNERLGPVRSTHRTGWTVQYQPGGARVDLTYSTTFARGSGTETFAFRMVDGQPKLLHYNIQLPLSLDSFEPADPSTPGANEG